MMRLSNKTITVVMVAGTTIQESRRGDEAEQDAKSKTSQDSKGLLQVAVGGDQHVPESAPTWRDTTLQC